MDELEINKTEYDLRIVGPILDLNLTLSAKQVVIHLYLDDSPNLNVSLSKQNAKNYDLIEELVEENYCDGMSHCKYLDKRNGSSIKLVYRYYDPEYDHHYYDEEHYDSEHYRDEYDSYDEEDQYFLKKNHR